MNGSQPPHPPLLPPYQPNNSEPPVVLGEHPDDVQVIDGFPGVIEALLRHPRRIVYHLHQIEPGRLPRLLFAVALHCSLTYGVIVGSFSEGAELWIAPLKISLGMFFAGFLCLPSLYIFASLGGSRARVSEVFGLLLSVLALATLLLIGFAPVAWIFSCSTESIVTMGVLHLLFCFISLSFGFRFLRMGFRHLGLRSTAGLNVWIIIFMLVMLQMTTTLHPLIGTSDKLLAKEKKFFLTHWRETMDNKRLLAKPIAVSTYPGLFHLPVALFSPGSST